MECEKLNLPVFLKYVTVNNKFVFTVVLYLNLYDFKFDIMRILKVLN